MRKFIRSLVFLFSIATMIFILGPGNYSSAAEAEYLLTKTNQTTYKGESILVFTEDITLNDFNSYGEASYPEVKEIIVAEGVTRFDWNLILRNFFPNLENISISSTVSEIYFYTKLYESFDLKYDKLKTIKVSEDNAYYTAKDNCLYNKKMTELIQYPVGSPNNTYIMPDSVESIKSSSLTNVKALQTITIGASLKSDQFYMIRARSAHIKEFKVDSKNPYYSVINGALFNKTGDSLLIYPNGAAASYQVPEGTVTIEPYAFDNNLKYIKLPTTLKTIKDSAFSAASNLISITIPKSVGKMNINYNFQYLESLEAIHVESGNKYYASYEGIIYNAAKTEMLFVPEAYKKTVLKFPSTLESLSIKKTTYEKAKEIVIPKGVKNIYTGSGDNAKFFDKITLAAGNKTFVIYKGSLYNKDKTKLVLFKKQQKAEFPSTLKSIDVEFLTYSGITELVISAKAKVTPGYNVYDIPTLKKVTVDKKNLYYSVLNNMLLNKDKTILYDVPRNLTTLNIPSTVKKVDFSEHFKSKKLKCIIIPKSVTEIYYRLYFDVKTLEKIDVEKGNTKFASIDGVLYNKNLSEIIYYPANKPNKSYVMPDSVKRMEYPFFITENPNLESLTLSKMLVEAGNYDFKYSKSLKEINVHKDNVSYKSVDGVLYNKDMSELLVYPYQKRDKSFTIPDTVITVSGFSYYTVKYINEDAYYTIDVVSNPYLETLNIGKNVKTLFETLYNYQIWSFKNLQNISVSKDNPYFASKDGALYNKELTIMYLYPRNSKNTVFTVSKSIKEISENVLESIAINKYLKTIVVEDGNQYFSTDGLTLRNFNGNYKYAKLGEELPKKIYR